MKEKQPEPEAATSIVRRLLEDKRLTEERYISMDKHKWRTAQDRRINDFNRLLTNGKEKENK